MMAALSVTYLLSILLQNLLFCIPIVAVLHGKMISKTYLIEKEEVTSL